MSNEILDALSQITREKSVDRQMLIETLEAGLAILPGAIGTTGGRSIGPTLSLNRSVSCLALRALMPPLGVRHSTMPWMRIPIPNVAISELTRK